MSTPGPDLETEAESTGLPAFPTWRAVYVFVVAFFAVIVTLMILLERSFA
ncbi:MAG TPA: hypothetical protein VKT78_13965 [Fimbriimonadaceae bacterium]|nr:hypothetical protein [Fimbriimonadaceae bacterium]